MKNKLIIIAHSEDGGTPEIHTFYSNAKAVSHIAEIVSGEYDVKPDPDMDFKDYFSNYYEWVGEKNDNMCDVTLTYTIVEI